MLRRTVALAGPVALLLVAWLVFAPGSTAASGGGCQLAGSASFTPNGPGTTATFGYSAAGQLTGCQSNAAGAPTSGALAVGQQLVETVTIQTPTGPQQVQATYAEPLATGSGALPVNSCPGGTTAGTAVVTWPDGTMTIVDFTTTSAGPAVALQGSVVPSLTMTLVSGPAGSPATYTLTSTNPTFPVGDGSGGLIAFTTNDPTPCTTAAGLSSVALQGAVLIGSPT